MTDKRKKRKLEELSTEELHSRIKEDKRKAGRSVIFMFSAVIAIIAICIAWFVSNTRVKLTTGTISTGDPTSFVLASTGTRQSVEQEYLRNSSSNILTEGTSKSYSKYIDSSTGQQVSTDEKTYYTGTANLAWYLADGDETLAPGASGTLEFYIIPQVENLTSVTVQMTTEAYVYADRTAASNFANATGSTDKKLQDLVSGHILLFHSSANADGYGKWLGIDGKFTVNAPKISDAVAGSEEGADGNDAATFQKGVPYKVTLDWVWPKYFRNYVYNQRANGDLYLNAESEDYKKVLEFVKAQTKLTTGYSKVFCEKSSGDDAEGGKGWTITGESISNSMSQADYDLCTEYYNNADEYIGMNAEFLYVEATVQ